MQRTHQLVDRPGMDGGQGDRMARACRAGDRDVADVVVIVEQLPDGSHRRGLADDLELDHRAEASGRLSSGSSVFWSST